MAIFVKESLFRILEVSVIDKSHDRILVVTFCDKVRNSSFIVFSCYLSRENSPRGRDAQSLLSHLLSVIYLNYEVDSILVCDDFNARIGNSRDVNSST